MSNPNFRRDRSSSPRRSSQGTWQPWQQTWTGDRLSSAANVLHLEPPAEGAKKVEKKPEKQPEKKGKQPKKTAVAEANEKKKEPEQEKLRKHQATKNS